MDENKMREICAGLNRHKHAQFVVFWQEKKKKKIQQPQ